MPDDRNALNDSNISGMNPGNPGNPGNPCHLNKRIPRYKMGDDNVIKISNDKQKYYLNIAAKIASKSPVYTHKHGAIIVYKDIIISSGYNFYIKGKINKKLTIDNYNNIIYNIDNRR